MSRVRQAFAVTVAIVAFGAAVVAAPGAARAEPLLPEPGGASLIPTGVINATGPSISADGRWVVYGGQTDDGRRAIFRTDTEQGTTVEMAPVPDGSRPGDTILPRISANGCVVVAITQIAYDLFRDDDRDQRWDVYRLVVPECDGRPNGWELVSSDATGLARDGVFVESPPTVSGSGAVVAYVHQSDASPFRLATVSVVDATVPIDSAGRSTTVRGMPLESPNRAYRYRGAYQPALSQNGRHLAFTSDADAAAALPGWSSGPVRGGWATTQVYVWDRLAGDQTRAVHLVSGREGSPSESGADSPAISEDGRVVAFVSPDRELVPAVFPRCASSCSTGVFRFDRDTDANGAFDEPRRPGGSPELALVSALGAGQSTTGLPVAADASAWSPSVNADGSSIAFVTDATNLLPSRRAGGGTASDGDLVVAEYHLGELRRVLDDESLIDVPGAHNRPAMSRSGGVLVFDTLAGHALAGHLPPAEGQLPPDPGRGRTLVITRVQPRLAMADLDFGSVLLAFESAELTVSVQNAGPAAFEVGEIEVDRPAFHVKGGSCAPRIVVAAGSSCSIKLTFNPTEARGYEGELTVRGLAATDPAASASLRGAAGEPALQATPGGADLPDGPVGSSAGIIAVSIENVGFVPLHGLQVTLAGKHPEQFQVTAEACTGRALNPDATCAVEVAFRPGTPGYHSALLVVRAGTGQYTAAVLGGYGYYAPGFDTDVEQVPAGTTFGVGGNGFLPGTSVQIGFDDGSPPLGEVTVREDGTFLHRLDMPARARGGVRRLVATGADGAVAVAEVIVRAAAAPVPAGSPGSGT